MLAEKAGLVLRPSGDPKHVFVPKRSRYPVKLGNGHPGIRHVAALERGASPGQDRVGPLASRGPGLPLSRLWCAAASSRGRVS